MVFTYYGTQLALYTVNATINLKINSDFFLIMDILDLHTVRLHVLLLVLNGKKH